MPSEPDPAEATEELSADLVADFLRRHPDFLASHAEVMERMTAPCRNFGSNVQDWQAYLIERLRGQTASLMQEQDDIIVRMRRERSQEERIHVAVLAMMEAGDLNRLVETVTTDLAMLLGVDSAALAVETRCPAEKVRRFNVCCLAPGALSQLIDDGRDVAVRSPARADERLFGPTSTLIGSEVLARFGGSGGLPRGVLALGSRHAGHFRPGDPVSPYAFLADVLDRCLREKLGLAR